MLRSLFYVFQGQRVRSEGEGDGQPPVSSATVAQENNGAHVVVNVGVNDLCPASALPVQSVAHSSESGQSICPNHNGLKWVEVDLSPECAGHVGEDTCKVQLRVVTMKEDVECVVGADARATEEPSTSHAQDVTLANSKDASMDVIVGHQQLMQPQNITISVQVPPPQLNNPDARKAIETAFIRTVSAVSADSLAEHCRICQLTTDEPLIELGCHCRGELAKAHRTCIQQWFNNKGSNKCEVCRHVATNLPAPISQPLQHFWVWTMSRSYRNGIFRGWQGTGQFHPLLAALLILVAGLMFDVLISYYLGASALPVNIIIGVLVVLGLGTAARLIMECWHERSIRRSIRRMEMAADMDHLRSNNGM